MTIPRPIAKFLVAGARKEKLTLSVYAALVGQLYVSLSAFLMLPAAGLLLTINDVVERGGYRAWACMMAMSAVIACRIEAYRRFKRAAPARKMTDVALYEAAAALTGVAMAAAIGVTECVSAFDGTTPEETMASLVITMGVAGLIGNRNGSRPNLAFLQVVLIVLPFASIMTISGRHGITMLGALIVIYLAATFIGTKAYYSSLRRALLDEQRVGKLNIVNRNQAQLFDTALNTMTSGLLLFDSARRVLVANDRAKEIMGVDLINRTMGRATYDFQDELFATYGCDANEQARVRGEFDRIMRGGLEDSFTMSDRIRGRTFQMRMRTIPGQGAAMNVDDVTEELKRDAEISRLAHHDGLTGLPNRVSLQRHLDRPRDRMQDTLTVAMFIDLDRFKAVNDEYGHGFGDALLVQVAQRLIGETQAGEFVARMAGDEFVIIFLEIEDRYTVALAAERIIAELSRPYEVLGTHLRIGASAGLSSTDEMVVSAKELLRTADVALYAAKSNGRGRALWFEKSMDEDARERREMTAELTEALGVGGLALHYQPIYDVGRNRVVACEALARWNHATYGDVPPSVFIKLAEESDLICVLGEWSLRRACRDARLWDPEIKVAVNLSALQFKHGSISATVTSILNETGLPARRLELEITESMLADDLEKMQFEINRLSRAGVSIVLDDFGTGYSSLSRLHALPIDKVKLDRSFVRRLGEDASAANLIASIVQMTRTMGKQLVIEGVETERELDQILKLNGNLIQGYLYSRPVSVSRLKNVIAGIEKRTTCKTKTMNVA